MPYIRLYSREVSLEEKRLLAQKLISIALDALQLRPEERNKINVQFIGRKLLPTVVDSLFHSDKPAALLEISDHDLTVRKITAFVDAAIPILSQSTVVGLKVRIARLLGIAPDASGQIKFQFNDTGSPKKNAGRKEFSPVAARIAA